MPEEGKAGPRFSSFERKQRRARVAELYCQGRYQHEIAKELQVTQQQISWDLKVLQKAYLKSAIASIEQRRLQELVKIDQLERTYWECFLRSMQPRETQKLKEKSTPAKKEGATVKGETEKSLQRQMQIGDPRWGERIEWCIVKRCELLGLDQLNQDMGNAANAYAAKLREDMRRAEEATLNDGTANDSTMDTDS